MLYNFVSSQTLQKWGDIKENSVGESVKSNVKVLKSQLIRSVNCGEDYEHHYRKKTRLELTRISAAVMGIEFSYAAETAFVSPTLLKIGVSQRHMVSPASALRVTATHICNIFAGPKRGQPRGVFSIFVLYNRLI